MLSWQWRSLARRLIEREGSCGSDGSIHGEAVASGSLGLSLAVVAAVRAGHGASTTDNGVVPNRSVRSSRLETSSAM